jgi:hybrid cluster-associated redox disulfide protein
MVKDYNIDLMDEEQSSKVESYEIDASSEEIVDKPASDKPILKSMIIAEVIDIHPDVIPILIQNGMHCIGCGASMFETLEEGLMGHGMDDREVNRVVDELNTYVKNIRDSPNSKKEDDE